MAEALRDAWRSAQGCEQILRALGAPDALVLHGNLVRDAAERLLYQVHVLAVEIDVTRVIAGAMLHDAGKALHPEELEKAGSAHEASGRTALAELGIDDSVARFCETHATWREPDLPLEDLAVALADKLWKGRREEDLETLFTECLIRESGAEPWTTMMALDEAYEAIAAGADRRLAQTR